MRIFDKYRDLATINKTPLQIPIITTDFYEDKGIKIKVGSEMKTLRNYLFTAEFYSKNEYNEFLKNFKDHLL